MIAALFVEKNGVYYELDGVDPWDKDRDARGYGGPWAVVAHPPCERWGRYARGGPNPLAKRREVGDDGGCFAAALQSVRKYGGVLEHPAASHAWRHFGLAIPGNKGGWVVADEHGGWTCHVEQGHYGHPSRKATWLYAVNVNLPSLMWGASSNRRRMDEGFNSKEHRKRARQAGVAPIKRLTAKERLATPLAFRDLLISMASSVATGGGQ